MSKKRFYDRIEIAMIANDRDGKAHRIGTAIMEITMNCEKLDSISSPGDPDSSFDYFTERSAKTRKHMEEDADEAGVIEDGPFGFSMKVL